MQIKKAKEKQGNERVIGLIYGQPGVGKTTLALSMPNPLLIDCERGLGRVSSMFRKDFVEPEKLTDIVISECADYDTIIFDTLGSLLELFDKHIKETNPKLVKSDGALSLQGYGSRKILFKNFISELRNSGKNVLFLAHVSEQKDGDITKLRPEASGSSINDLENMLDFMGYMEMRGNKRSISFTPNDTFYAKNALRLEQYIEVPEAYDKNDFLSKIIVEGNQKRLELEKELSKKYVEVLTKVSELITKAKDPNAITEELKKLDHIYDSKMRSWEAVKTFATGKGYTWNAEKKVWEK